MIQTNVIHESHRSGVRRLLFLGSSCIYPKMAPQPLKEEYLSRQGHLSRQIVPTRWRKSRGLKCAGRTTGNTGRNFWPRCRLTCTGRATTTTCRSCARDSWVDSEDACEAKVAGAAEVDIWGTGYPRREFLYSDAAADACIFLLNLPEGQFKELTQDEEAAPIVNIGCGDDITIGVEPRKARRGGCGVSGADWRSTLRSPNGTPRGN